MRVQGAARDLYLGRLFMIFTTPDKMPRGYKYRKWKISGDTRTARVSQCDNVTFSRILFLQRDRKSTLSRDVARNSAPKNYTMIIIDLVWKLLCITAGMSTQDYPPHPFELGTDSYIGHPAGLSFHFITS